MRKLLCVGAVGVLEEHCFLLGRWAQPSLLSLAWFTSPHVSLVSRGDWLAVRALREMSQRFQVTLTTRCKCIPKMTFTGVCDSFSFIFKAVRLSGAERRPAVPQRREWARGCKCLDEDEFLNCFSTNQGLSWATRSEWFRCLCGLSDRLLWWLCVRSALLLQWKEGWSSGWWLYSAVTFEGLAGDRVIRREPFPFFSLCNILLNAAWVFFGCTFLFVVFFCFNLVVFQVKRFIEQKAP